MNGEGICKNPNGTFLKGNWVNQHPHGKGEETFPDNSSYIGDFV